MAERRIDDGLHHFGRRIGLADPFESRVGTDAYQNRILTTGRLRRDVLDSQNLADDFGNLHGSSGCDDEQTIYETHAKAPRRKVFTAASTVQT
jgi:hypothetical protein